MVWWFLSSLSCEKMFAPPVMQSVVQVKSNYLISSRGSEFIQSQDFVYFPYHTDECALCFLFVPTRADVKHTFPNVNSDSLRSLEQQLIMQCCTQKQKQSHLPMKSLMNASRLRSQWAIIIIKSLLMQEIQCLLWAINERRVIFSCLLGN